MHSSTVLGALFISCAAAIQPFSVVLAHGAFSRNTTYQPWFDAQNTQNARVVAPQLVSAIYPGNTQPDPNAYGNDRAVIRQAVINELNANRDVVLVAHSYGGIPGADALNGLLGSRSNGKKILGIVFVSAFVVETNNSIVTSSPFNPPWVIYNQNNNTFTADNPQAYFFNDINRQDRRDALAAGVLQTKGPAFFTTSASDPWKQLPSVWVNNTNDTAMVADQRDYFYNRLVALSQYTPIKQDLEADHFSFVSRPGAMARIVRDAVVSFRQI